MSTTKVSSILDLLEAEIKNTFPNKTEAPNPFEIESNNERFLRDGFALYYGAGSSDIEEFPTFQVYIRSVQVVLIKSIFKNRSDDQAYQDIQKSLLEDQNTLITSLAKSRAFDSNVISLEFANDNGIESVFSDKFNFLKLDSTFELRYREDKNYRYPN